MSEDKPIPPNKKRQQRLLRTQNKFWDFVNSIELPIIIFMQKHFKAYSSTSFWNFVAKIASPRYIRFLPLLFYSLGYEEQSKYLALSLVYFSLFSSFGKYLIIRRRPGSYSGVHSPACASTSSFPSRHTISITISAFFFPFSYLWIFLIIMSRIMLGMHFLTDCILGIFVGKFALYIAPLITDPNYCLFLLLVTFRIWSGAYKILSGSLPLLIVSSISCSSFRSSPLCFFLVFLWKFVRNKLPPAKIKSSQSEINVSQQKVSKSSDMITEENLQKRSHHSSKSRHSDNYNSQSSAQLAAALAKKTPNPYELLVIELIPISLIVLLISETNKLLFCIRQIDFANDLNMMDSKCSLCSSHFTSSLFPHLLKFTFFRKILAAIKTVDIFSIQLRDKIAEYLARF